MYFSQHYNNNSYETPIKPSSPSRRSYALSPIKSPRYTSNDNTAAINGFATPRRTTTTSHNNLRTPRLSSPSRLIPIESPISALSDVKNEKKQKELEYINMINRIKSLEIEQMKMNLRMAKVNNVQHKIDEAKQVKMKKEADKLRKKQDLTEIERHHLNVIQLIKESKERMNQNLKETERTKRKIASSVKHEINDLRAMSQRNREEMRRMREDYVQTLNETQREKKREINNEIKKIKEQNYHLRKESQKRNEEEYDYLKKQYLEQRKDIVKNIRDNRVSYVDVDMYNRANNKNKVATSLLTVMQMEKNEANNLQTSIERLREAEISIRRKLDEQARLLEENTENLRKNSSSLEEYIHISPKSRRKSDISFN